ncbi:MAG: hypothetical protein DLM61_14265 [Pseudonocardiales bacterium]|nr:MAG: hypothetical protein DLM61_14265 [Pseudonocardiales bacterium]
MSQPYPIIEQRSLEPSQKRGFLGLGKRLREGDELPKPNAHHNLVYRVDGQYILDNAELPLDAQHVTNATHVSLVDMTRDAAVMVQLDIPSADASAFTMQVTFVCTVNNPITVVREGLLRADARLRAYLKSHSKLFELGLDYPVSQINEVRRIVNAQVKAFTTIEPLVVPGLSIDIASIEVLTPNELVTFEKSRRDLRRDHELTAERQHYGQTLEYDRERHGQRMTTDARRHEQSLEAEKRAFERHELSELMDAVGGNSLNALYLAYAAGELGSGDLFSKLMAEQQRKQEIERADRLSQIERDCEDRKLALEQDREDRRQKREEQLRHVTVTREDVLRRQQWEREDKRLQQDVNLEVIRELAKRGHLDVANPNIDQMLADLVATPPTPAVESEPTPELARSTDSERDVAVREEDEN